MSEENQGVVCPPAALLRCFTLRSTLSVRKHAISVFLFQGDSVSVPFLFRLACALLSLCLRGTRKEELTVATPNQSTLLALVQTVSDCATSDDEIVATVAYLINSGKVLLCGTFAGARIDLSAPACAAPKEHWPKAAGLARV